MSKLLFRIGVIIWLVLILAFVVLRSDIRFQSSFMIGVDVQPTKLFEVGGDGA